MVSPLRRFGEIAAAAWSFQRLVAMDGVNHP